MGPMFEIGKLVTSPVAPASDNFRPMESFRISASNGERAAILEAANALHMESSGRNSPARLISQLCDERLTAEELVARIEAHPVLCARVLKVANSPYYGQGGSVATVKRALLLLGLNAVRGITAAACIRQVMPHRMGVIPDLPAIMKHSLATAVACDMLATAALPNLASDAFIAGLIHNLGTVVQASLNPTGTAALIATRLKDATGDLRTVELQHCQPGHEECAAVLFDAWGLPDALVISAQHHHAPEQAPESHRLLTQLVWAGGHLALSCRTLYAFEPVVPVRDDARLLALGLLPKHLDAVTGELAQRVDFLNRSLMA
jgi:HD-like signal output (HDOD) protein